MPVIERRSPDIPLIGGVPDASDISAHIQCTLILGLLVALPTAAWMQHVFSCVVSGSWGFLVGGTLFLPAGLVHGIGCWLGFWG
jgi:hypothetical protein